MPRHFGELDRVETDAEAAGSCNENPGEANVRTGQSAGHESTNPRLRKGLRRDLG